MNLRKENLVEVSVNSLDQIEIKEDSLLVSLLPDGVPLKTSSVVGESLVSALRSIGASNPVLLLPYSIQIQTLDPKDVKELGWSKDDQPIKCNSDNNRLPGYIESHKIVIPLNEQRRIWERQVTELLGKLQDTRPNPPGANTSGYLDPSIF